VTALGLALGLGLVACAGAAAPATPATPSASSAAASSSPLPATPVIPMCTGQAAPPPADTPRSGPMRLELAPAFLDRMPACSAAAATLPAARVDASAGVVNDKGECAWPGGVTCHFHVGVEFVPSGVPRPALGELHCIFPNAAEPKSPTVYGAHFSCPASADRTPHVGAACGAGLLPQLAAAATTCDARCCDDGTLTTTPSAREQAGTLDVRPDFRMCAAPIQIDCGALANLVGRPANAPVYDSPQ